MEDSLLFQAISDDTWFRGPLMGSPFIYNRAL